MPCRAVRDCQYPPFHQEWGSPSQLLGGPVPKHHFSEFARTISDFFSYKSQSHIGMLLFLLGVVYSIRTSTWEWGKQGQAEE